MKIKFYTVYLTSEQKLQFNKVSSEEGIKDAETLDSVETASRSDILDRLFSFDVYHYIDFESFLFDLKKAGNATVYSSQYVMDSLMVGEGDDRKCVNLVRWNVLNDILDELVNYSEAHAKKMLEE